MSFFPEVITYSKKNQITYDDGGVATIDGTVGNAFELTVDGTSVTIAHNNTPQDVEYEFRLSLNWVSGSITFPSEWTTGQPAPTGTGYYVITGRTVDSGASWDIRVGGDGAPSPSAYGLAGVDFQVTNTKPTTRSDGSALSAGDRWYKSDDGTEWFWNGTYWLSGELFQADRDYTNLSFTFSVRDTGGLIYSDTDKNIFLESVSGYIAYRSAQSPGGTIDSDTNYWTYAVGLRYSGNATLSSDVSAGSSQGITNTTNEQISFFVSMDTAYDLSSLDVNNRNSLRAGILCTETGSPAAIDIVLSYNYRLLYP